MGRPEPRGAALTASSRLLAAVVAALAAFATAASAQETRPASAPKIALAVETRWESGETVTMTLVETRRRTMEEQRDPKKPKTTRTEERTIEGELVVRCDEATPEGRFVRGRAYLKRWRRAETSFPTESLTTGLHSDLADGECRFVEGPSPAPKNARTFVLAVCSNGRPEDCSGREWAGTVPPLEVGASVPVPLPYSNPAIDYAATLVSAKQAPDGLVVVATKKGTSYSSTDGHGSTTVREEDNRASALLERWHRASQVVRRQTERSTTPNGSASSVTTWTRTWSAGGEIPPRPGEKPPDPPAPSPPPK